jgi:hypothetical protein
MEGAKGVAGEAFFVTNGAPMPFWDFLTQVLTGFGYMAPRCARHYLHEMMIEEEEASFIRPRRPVSKSQGRAEQKLLCVCVCV